MSTGKLGHFQALICPVCGASHEALRTITHLQKQWPLQRSQHRAICKTTTRTKTATREQGAELAFKRRAPYYFLARVFLLFILIPNQVPPKGLFQSSWAINSGNIKLYICTLT
ncbi:unnamed protein product [Ixodes pacificus]